MLHREWLGRAQRAIAFLPLCLTFALGQGHKDFPKQTEVAQLPDGFAEQRIATGIDGATGMAVTPDGRLLICEQAGALRVVKDDVLLPEPFVTLDVDSFWERGLIGVAVDPRFERNGYVYLHYTAREPYTHFRVSRFTARGDRAIQGSEKILLAGDDQSQLGGRVPAGHQGGGMAIGNDGKLYILIGEMTTGAPSQDLDTFLGKILRINRDGTIPADNPFYSETDGKYRAIWALGLRNPFGIAVQKSTGQILVNDVGGSRWEEVNHILPGGNYGWPHAEGVTNDPDFISPIHAYPHQPRGSISGGTFYEPERPQFPAEWQGKYYFAEYEDNWIRILDPDAPEIALPFASELSGPVALAVVPDGSLYYLNRNAWIKDGKFTPHTSSLHKIFYVLTADVPAPRITSAPADVTCTIGQSSTFRVVANGQSPLTYQWQRNGQNLRDANAATLTLANASTEDDRVEFRCIVSNRFGAVKSRSATLWLTQLHDAVQVRGLAAGLSLQTFAGQWDALPDFDELQPDRELTIASIDAFAEIGMAGKPRADRPVNETSAPFAARIRGYVYVDEPGAYTLHMASAGAAKLFVQSKEVVSVSSVGSRADHGTIGLRRGRHPIELLVSHPGGDPQLEVTCRGPNGVRSSLQPDQFGHRPLGEPPRIQPAGGDYEGPILLRLTAARRDAVIRYTTDGTIPVPSSTRYRGPFWLDESATVIAGVFTDDRVGQPLISRQRYSIQSGTSLGMNHRQLAKSVNISPDPRHQPPLLSQTGLFQSLADLTPVKGLIPYEVNSPAWVDGAHTRRWIALPGTSRIEASPTGTWRFPAGTILVQQLQRPNSTGSDALGSDASSSDASSGDASSGDASSFERLETRLLRVGRRGHGFGVTYRWHPDGRDASLVDEDSARSISPDDYPGPVAAIPWHTPSRDDCASCHNALAGFVLGVNTRQLNRSTTYNLGGKNVVDDQLRAWSRAGMFSEPLAERDASDLPRLANSSDSHASIETRIRSYLDVNCAHCHRPGGARGIFDARFALTSSSLKLLDSPPKSSDFGIRRARIVAPGDPFRSTLLYRMAKVGLGRMPPLGSSVVDPTGLELAYQWIRSLPAPPAGKVKTTDRQQQLALAPLAATTVPSDKQIEESLKKLLSSTDGSLRLAIAMGRGRIPDETSNSILPIAVRHPDIRVRDLFERFLPPQMQSQRLGDDVDPETILSLRGNPVHGRGLYLNNAVQCKSCHRIGNLGLPVGPRLDGVGKKYPLAKLLETLLHPSKEIDPKYQSYTVVTDSGRAVVGVITDQSPEYLVLVDQAGRQHRIAVSTIEQSVPHDKSLMPDGLLRQFTAQQAADLLAFLSTLQLDIPDQTPSR